MIVSSSFVCVVPPVSGPSKSGSVFPWTDKVSTQRAALLRRRPEFDFCVYASVDFVAAPDTLRCWQDVINSQHCENGGALRGFQLFRSPGS
jgi:hypothetical protein